MAWGDTHSAAELAAAAGTAGFSGAEVPVAVAVALAESGGRMVVNTSSGETPRSLRGVEKCASFGPWQINYCPGRDAGSARERAAKTPDLKLHAAVAYSIYREQGWRAWTMHSNGGYKRFLEPATEAVRKAGSSGGGTSAVGGALSGGLVGGVPGAIVGGGAGFLGGEARDATQGLIRRYGQIVGGTLLAGAGLVILLRDLAPQVALGALTGGGSVAANLAAETVT